MRQSLDENVIRVLNTKGETVGTGFVVADCLAVTCAHVVEAAGSVPGSAISTRFYNQMECQAAQVLPEPWSPASADDLAFLRLPSMPEMAKPLIMCSASQSDGHTYQSLGFPKNNKDQARGALDLIVMLVHATGRQDLLQLKGEEVYFGMSGAPVYDRDLDRVVGMITKGVDDKYTRFVYATTTDTICQYHPELHLDTPIEEKRPLLPVDRFKVAGSVCFEDGRPVEKASVRVIGLDLDPVITGADGYFEFIVEDDPSWQVVAAYKEMSVKSKIEKTQLDSPLVLYFPHLACFSIDSPAENEEVPLGENQSRIIEGSFPILSDFPELAEKAKITLDVLKFPEGNAIPQTGTAQISFTQGKWYYMTAHFEDEGSYTLVATARIGKKKDFRRIQVQGIKKQEYYRKTIADDRKARGVEDRQPEASSVQNLEKYRSNLYQKQNEFWAHYKKRDLDQALEVISSTLEILDVALPAYPEDSVLQNMRAYFFKNYAMVMRDIHQKDESLRALVEAEKMFRAVLDQHPNDAGAWNGLGSVATLRGEYQKALQYVDKALEIMPRYPAALSDRKYILRALGRGDSSD